MIARSEADLVVVTSCPTLRRRLLDCRIGTIPPRTKSDISPMHPYIRESKHIANRKAGEKEEEEEEEEEKEEEK